MRNKAGSAEENLILSLSKDEVSPQTPVFGRNAALTTPADRSLTVVGHYSSS